MKLKKICSAAAAAVIGVTAVSYSLNDITASAGGMGSIKYNVLLVKEGEESAHNVYKSYTCGDFTYSLRNDGTAEIVDYTGSSAKIEVPELVDGIKVTAVSFYVNKDVEDVILPDDVRMFGYEYQQSKWYKSLKADDNGLIISQGRLLGCDDTVGTVVEVPEGVTQIAPSVFENLGDITEVRLPDTLRIIGDRAFFGCTALEKINFPGSLESVGQMAFDETKWLTDSLAKSDYAVANSILVGVNAAYDANYVLPEGVNAVSSPYMFTNYEYPEDRTKVNTTLTFPASFKKIENSAFEFTMINNLVISSEIVEDYAFGGADKLRSVTLEEGVKSIGDYSFITMSEHYFDMPEEEMPVCEFNDIIIPKSIEDIGECAVGYQLVIDYKEMSVDESIEKIPGFTIYCYKDTAGEKYAADNGFNYVLMDNYGKVKGDITGDAKLDTKDAMKAIAFAKKTAQPKGPEFAAADVNNDGKLDSKDALIIINAAKNKTAIK